MNNKEAIEVLKEITSNRDLVIAEPDYFELVASKYHQSGMEAMKIAIKILEEPTAERAILDDEYSYFKCNCGATIEYGEDYREHNYCMNCGQKLDWSDEND